MEEERGAPSDGLGGILLADENLQEAELGFDPLVLLVLLQHRDPVLLLHIPERREKLEKPPRKSPVQPTVPDLPLC